MMNKIKISFIALCLLTSFGFCDEDMQNLDKGKGIFKHQKTKKEKVKPVKQKRQYKVSKKVKQ